MVFGGMGRQESDAESVDLFDTVFDDAVFQGVADTTYPMGLIVGRVAGGEIVPFVSGGGAPAGEEIPIGVIKTPFTTDAGPADVPLRMIVGGQVREDLLVIGAAGVPGAGITEAIKDMLRDHSIIAKSRTDIAKLDN